MTEPKLIQKSMSAEQIQHLMTKGVKVSVTTCSEPWMEYALDDGTVIRLRLVLMDARRLEGEYDEVGNPQYALKISPVIQIEPAAQLRKTP